MAETEADRTYRIGRTGERYEITVCCRTTVGERTVYLETSRDITSIFQEREMQFDTYTEWSIVLLLLSAIVMLAVSMFLTRPLARLSACLLYTSAGAYGQASRSKRADRENDGFLFRRET